MKQRSAILTACLAAAGCGATQSTAPLPGSTSSSSTAVQGPIRVSFECHKLDGHATGRVAQNAELRTGDQIRFQIELNLPAYLYVVQLFADKTAAVVFPEQGDMLVAPGITLLPPSGKLFELDEVTGIENVFIIASSKPVTSIDQELGALLDTVRVAKADGTSSASTAGAMAPDSAPAVPAPEHKPDAATPARPSPIPHTIGKPPAPRDTSGLYAGLTLSRGLKVVSPNKDSMTCETDPKGVAVCGFSFRHLPKP